MLLNLRLGWSITPVGAKQSECDFRMENHGCIRLLCPYTHIRHVHDQRNKTRSRRRSSSSFGCVDDKSRGATDLDR